MHRNKQAMYDCDSSPASNKNLDHSFASLLLVVDQASYFGFLCHVGFKSMKISYTAIASCKLYHVTTKCYIQSHFCLNPSMTTKLRLCRMMSFVILCVRNAGQTTVRLDACTVWYPRCCHVSKNLFEEGRRSRISKKEFRPSTADVFI